MTPDKPPKARRLRLPARFTAISWRDLAASFWPLILLCVLGVWAAFAFVRPAPPDTLVITTGPDGSSYRANAEKYRKILARNGVKLEILASQGSLENVKRLRNPEFRVDVGFVQGGLANGGEADELVSLGSISHQPLVIFYRNAEAVDRLAQLAGQRIAIGREGSGGRFLALTLLKANGIEPGGATELSELAGSEAADALVEGRVDAAFLTGDSAPLPVMRKLFETPEIRVVDFAQAEAYVRRFRYLNKLELPMGSLDFGKNVPERALTLIGPTTELIARPDLHAALSDLLIEAAREVHGHATLLQRAGEFPAPIEREFPISDDAARYYKSGKGFLYRFMPFWVASLLDRVVVILVPILVLLIPGVRLVPVIYRWRVSSRIYRWYGALLALERDLYAHPEPEERDKLRERLEAIERGVNGMKVPIHFADQFYVLRQHIGFVRERLA